MHTKLIKKIFVVDDDKLSACLLKDQLTSKFPHDVHLFDNGEDCLKHLAEQPDIVILDFNLNSEFKDAANGLQILEAIKKTDFGIRVIMLSGQDDYGTALISITKGAEEYVLKSKEAFEEIEALCNQ